MNATTRTHALGLLSCALLSLGACATSDLDLSGPDAGDPLDAADTQDASVADSAADSAPDTNVDASALLDASDPPDVAPGPCTRDEDCLPGQTCDVIAGDCEDPPTSTCGDGVCDGVESCATCLADCGCDANQTCSAGSCLCDDPCEPGQTQCSGDDERVCASDANGCAFLEPPMSCAAGTCSNGSCCDASCGARECGDDACGGSCGTCSFACNPGGYCSRQLIVNWVRTDCDANCQDAFDPTDPYIQITLAGATFDKDKGERDRCDNTLTAQGWTVGSRTFTHAELRSVRVEVLDQDRLSNDDTCATWSRVDLSAIGTTEITSADGLVVVSFTTQL